MRFGITLIGGDTTATPGPLTHRRHGDRRGRAGRMLTARRRESWRRRLGHGTIGDAALGLRVLQGRRPWHSATAWRALVARYRVPEPRHRLGPAATGARARLPRRVGRPDRRPRSHLRRLERRHRDRGAETCRCRRLRRRRSATGVDIARLVNGRRRLRAGLRGCRQRPARGSLALAAETKVRLTRIGVVVKGRGVARWMRAGRQPMRFERAGYAHF